MDGQSPSRSSTPVLAPPLRRPVEEDHSPAISSPLNPDSASRPRATKPPQREQREKRETLKKREANASTRGNTPDVKVKNKGLSTPSPMRYSIPEPRPSDYEAPKDGVFAPHEPIPLFTPDGETELKRPVDHAWNKRGYRYTHCVADPHFRHKQFYRQSDSKPFGPRMSFEDTDKWFHLDDTGTIFSNEKGWRMGRGNVAAREGRMYYEVKMIRGVPPSGPPIPPGQEGNPQPHIRMGWARREAPLDAPVGFDGYSYGITDIRFESIHRSRAGKLYKPLPKGSKSKHAKSRPPHGKLMPVEYIPDSHVREGDVIGLEITLPSLSLHRKVIEGIYNPAVDLGDGFAEPPPTEAADIIRDRIPVPYKSNFYFEQLEYQATKHMETYSDRGPVTKVFPNPNHEEPSLRSLPYSSIRVYLNGQLIGTAFESLLSFLPPASAPYASAGARVGFDDGMLGYFPAVAAFCGGMAQVNFGPDFWFPPAPAPYPFEDIQPDANGEAASHARKLKAIGERYRDQIAEDIVWDLVDEVDFFVQDGGYAYKDRKDGNAPDKESQLAARGIANLQDDVL